MSSLFLAFSRSAVLIPISKCTMVKILMAYAIFSTIKAYNFKTIYYLFISVQILCITLKFCQILRSNFRLSDTFYSHKLLFNR